jgi:two-component system, CAI-1 autoinducer sensor kinase/phosphatase CqsS
MKTLFSAEINPDVPIALLAIVGFPLYYWIWTDVFPQPYENFPLRLVGVVTVLPLLLPQRYQHEKWFALYFQAALTYCLPFFFTFMFLMNRGSTVWSQSLMIAVFMLFHLATKLALLLSLIGGSCAYVAYVAASRSHDISAGQILPTIPVVMFAILSMTVMKIGRQLLVDEKLRAMASTIGVISHELRTPLRSVDASVRGLKRYLPMLVAFYREHHAGSAASSIHEVRMSMIEPTLDRIQTDVQYMNNAIDLLLTNSSKSHYKAQERNTFAIGELVSDALNRYPFEDDRQRSQAHLAIRADFRVNGNKDLCMMVVFNLLKNALHAIAKKGQGVVSITIDHDAENRIGRLIFRDTGCGIPASEIANVFRRFYAFPRDASTGIGLAFCRETLAMWDASIDCRSEPDVFTEFMIRFQDAASC